MITITGTHNEAICYCDELEAKAAAQIKTLCLQKAFADCKIRIMPDVHAGMGCTIGTTMSIRDKIVPGMVGVDIGCGMETTTLKESDIDLARLDEVIRKHIPSGRSVRESAHALNDEIQLDELRCVKQVNLGRARRSIGSLGGGNHFIELNRGSDGCVHLVIHSGSRHLGHEVADYYQKTAFEQLYGTLAEKTKEIIATLKAEGRYQDIAPTLDAFKAQHAQGNLPPKELTYVEGALFDDYLHDMKIVQHFAVLNRRAMTAVILEEMGLHEQDRFTTIHNYIDTDSMMLRKGAVSARAGERLLIPINMRDGSLICVGKGNDDWNQSAPHGAGRLYSRTTAFKQLSMDEYKKQMEGIYTTSVSELTLDEAPMAYKSMESIVKHITPTAEIVDRIIPIYNFKASE